MGAFLGKDVLYRNYHLYIFLEVYVLINGEQKLSGLLIVGGGGC